MAKDPKMTKKTPVPVINETVASDSLHPNTKPDTGNPKSRLETISKIVSMAHDLPIKDLTKWFDDTQKLFPAVGLKNTGNADSNRKTNNMASGGKSPIAPMGMEKLKAPTLNANVKEDFEKIFEGQDLSEEFKEQSITLFEAALNARVGMEVIRLEEEFEAALTEQVQNFIDKTDQTIDAYLNYSVDKWMTENEVAIVDSLRLENAEEVIEKFKQVFVESYFDVPQERVDIVNEMAEQVESLESSLSEALTQIAQLTGSITESQREKSMSKLTEGMTLVDKEKLQTLTESIDFEDAQSFSKKVKVIKEKYFAPASKPKNEGVETLNEHSMAPAEEVVVDHDPLIAAALAAMNVLR